MEIIIKKDSLNFKPHFNKATGRGYHTKEDYLSDLKKRGLEPVKEGRSDEHKFKKKAYSGVSDEARNMMNSVSYDKKTGKPNIGDRYIDQLKKMGMREMPKDLIGKTQGGYR